MGGLIRVGWVGCYDSRGGHDGITIMHAVSLKSSNSVHVFSLPCGGIVHHTFQTSAGSNIQMGKIPADNVITVHLLRAKISDRTENETSRIQPELIEVLFGRFRFFLQNIAPLNSTPFSDCAPS